jgi:hypothetical protein
MVLFFKKYHETGIFDENEIYSILQRELGDILPKNVSFSLMDLQKRQPIKMLQFIQER